MRLVPSTLRTTSKYATSILRVLRTSDSEVEGARQDEGLITEFAYGRDVQRQPARATK